jgi:tripartite-type tricarboxylate transporter receptor subunit TctC
MKLPSRRQFLHLAAGTAVLPAVSRVVRAQAYPTRPVRIVVGFPAGGALDTIVRIMAQWLSERLGQQFIVENKPGAATNIALQAALTSPPDGYTLAHIASSTAVNATLYDNLAFDFLRDASHVAGLVNFPHVIAIHPSLPAKSVPELIAYAKLNPGKISIASYGTGTVSHLANALLNFMAGINLVHVPYRGDALVFSDLLSNRVQMYIATLTGTLPHFRSGALRALAVTGKMLHDALPDVPTVGEFIPGYEVDAMAGIGVRRGTPNEIIETLNRQINAGLLNPAIKARLTELAATPLIFSPMEFTAYMTAEKDKWGKVIRAANIKPE